jgi:hypothetical protein
MIIYVINISIFIIILNIDIKNNIICVINIIIFIIINIINKFLQGAGPIRYLYLAGCKTQNTSRYSYL